MSNFADKLIDWYEENKRDLPWRDTKDPYRIWISEIILQQTRVAQGYGYFVRFMERFPDVFTLAEAEEDEVMKYWQGLGYYSYFHVNYFLPRMLLIALIPFSPATERMASATLCFASKVIDVIKFKASFSFS